MEHPRLAVREENDSHDDREDAEDEKEYRQRLVQRHSPIANGPKKSGRSLQAAIEGRQKAVDTRNAADWGRYSTDDFMLVSAEGEIQSRENRMKALTASTNKRLLQLSSRISACLVQTQPFPFSAIPPREDRL